MKSKLIEALQTIKDVCAANKYCEECPLGDIDCEGWATCIFDKSLPGELNIDEVIKHDK